MQAGKELAPQVGTRTYNPCWTKFWTKPISSPGSHYLIVEESAHS